MSGGVGRSEIMQRLTILQAEMNEVGILMEYYGGVSEVAQHGRELYGASNIMKSWIEGMEDE
jgi:hypothetical protein